MSSVAGSSATFQLRSDLWQYDITAGSWSQLSGTFVSGETPIERQQHTAVVIGDVMYVYGGQDREQTIRNDVIGYDLTTNQWFSPNRTATGARTCLQAGCVISRAR